MVEGVFALSDELGPAKVLHVSQPALGLKAVLVVDNVATGPAIGGLRMAEDVSTGECARLARAMTLKNAAAGLAHGGGKSVLYGDPKMDRGRKERLIRAFAYALRHEADYIFGPDMGTDEQCMAWIKDEIGRSVGLPCEIGGIPLDRIGATGWGVSHAVDVAREYCDFDLAGINVAALIKLKADGGSVLDYPKGEKLDRDKAIDLECEIWVPAARPDVLREDNVRRLRARLVAQGANIPLTLGAEQYLHDQGVLCLPDFITNAGRVICAAMEYNGSSQTAALETIKEKIVDNILHVLEEAKRDQILPREAASRLATQRVRKAIEFKRWGIF